MDTNGTEASSSPKINGSFIDGNGAGQTHRSASKRVQSWPVGTTEPGGTTQAQTKLKPEDYSASQREYPRISRPVELLRHTYDVVVIGSGYGGGVAASRMSRAGQSVCVLERGRERWPGEYPDTLASAVPEISVSGLFAPKDFVGRPVKGSDPTKLYQLVVGQGQNAFVASGLGGTSLLNANVFLRADPGTMSLPEWPADLREPGALEKYYQMGEQMLQPERYPKDFPPLPKLDVLEKQSEFLSQQFARERSSGGRNPGRPRFDRVPQTTRFENGPNSAGVQMQASTLTGMDSTGVNDGSKSSTLVTYLADAWNWGTEIFCECEVRYIKEHPNPDVGGYLVFFAWHGSKRARFKNNIYGDLMWIHAKKFVFFGAGALGTTEILLRSQSLGLKMSKRIGKEMSGNGDILAFGYNTNKKVNGRGNPNPSPEHPIGPTITGVIDCRDQANPLDGFVIEEGAITAPLVPVLQAMLELMPGKILPTAFGLPEMIRHFISRQTSWIWDYAPFGSLQRTQTYLIMSHDSNQAVMTLESGKPAIRWLGVGRSDHVTYLNGLLEKITDAIGGTYINSPFYAALGKQEITVHAIGRACIAADEDGRTGAVDSYGRLLKGSNKAVYDGLVVVDGAAIPTALGVNPFATITALAERSVEAAANRKGLKIDYKTSNGILDLYRPARRQHTMDDELQAAHDRIRTATDESSEGIEFTEVMSGYINIQDDVDDFDVAYEAASAAGGAARFFLSVHAWDTDELVNLAEHPAMLTGSFTCAGLVGSPFMVLRGDFGLFTRDPKTPDTANLKYEFDMISTHGEMIHFSGYKVVDPSIALQPWETWRATSTLNVTLTKEGTRIGCGKLNIQPIDFISELKTFQPTGSSWLPKLSSTSKFLSFFTSQVASKFFGSLGPQEYPTSTFAGYETNTAAPYQTLKVTSSDGIVSTLQHWLPTLDVGDRPPAIFFIPGASVDHQIFALPTIDTNAVEYFQGQGFEVFCLTHRVGKTPAAMLGGTTYDARLDIRAAFKKIHAILDSPAPIYVIAHCAGSVALSAGLLDGTIPADWLLGLTASQVFMNPIFGKVNRIKASMPLSMTTIYKAAVGNWFSCTSTKHDTLVQRLLNQVVKLYPVGSTRELCNSVVCHRSELVFGRLWSHRKLNAATHSNLSKFLGGTSMRSLEHLMYMGTHGFVADNDKTSLITSGNLDRLKGLPILFIQGSENVVYSPESTDKSFTTLTRHFQQAGYEREVIQGYGHLDCWMSDSAVRDVYPIVQEHVFRCMAGAKAAARAASA